MVRMTPAASADSTAQTGHAGDVDWQEECYQKVVSMKELYYADLSEFHHKINMKLQQQEAQGLPGKQPDQYEKLKGYKLMLDRMLHFLQISSKNNVPIGLKEKLPMYEKKIVNMVTSQRPKKMQLMENHATNQNINAQAQSAANPSQVKQEHQQQLLQSQQMKQQQLQQQRNLQQRQQLLQHQQKQQQHHHISHQSSPQIDQNIIPVDSEKPIPVTTPGISASPLLAECNSQDGNQAIILAATERPVDRLIKMVQSLAPNSLSSSVTDIASVVSMVDRIAGSAPGNGSRTAVGEDLAAMTKCRLQARNFAAKRMKRHTSAMPSELESTATSRVANRGLVEEIEEINWRLVDTVVDVSDEDAAKGTVVKCCYTAVALSPDLKVQFVDAPIMPMRLLVPADYPNCSPVLLDCDPVEPREIEDLSSKAKSKFGMSLRCLSEPMSLGEMVKTWDVCARKVVLEYAQQAGGGIFSSTYGSWEYCVGA